ncbi:hypothetical protein I4U23_007849 [Adineta vaga]|nr:hypothetical protein I4U23_007849 [Adineta vaga]
MCICGPNTQYWNSTANSCFPVDEYLSLCDLTTSYSCDQSAGLYCLTPGQGSQCPFNATSSSTSCDCTNGTYWNGGSCVSKKLINTACFWNCECDSDRGLSCLNMTCLCPTKYYWSTLTNPPACVPQKNYTDTTCFNTSECDTTQGLTCYLSGTSCNCPQPSVIKMCDCLTTQYYDSNLTSCQTLQLYNETCYGSYMCDNTVGLFCQTNVSSATNCSCPEPIRLNMCDCNITSYWDGTACVARLAPNISCTYDYECQAGYVCIVNETDIGHFSDVCRCPLGQYYVNGTGCIPSLNYSEPCVGSYQCYEISPLYCRYNYSNVTCLGIGYLPACDCQDNYYYSSLNRSCLALLNRYETCEEPCQCVQPFTCKQDDFKCDCMYFYSSLNQTCVQYLQYGDNCSSTAQCENTTNAFMICDNGACACNSSGYWNGSQCVFTTNFRMTCTKKSQCYGDLDCRTIDCLGSGKVCVCPNGKYFSTVNTSCVQCNGNDGDYEREVVYLADRDVCAAFRSPRTSPSRTYTSANTDCSGLVPFGSNNVPWLLSLHTGSDLKCLNQVMKSFDDKATCSDELYYLGLNSSTALFFDGTPYYSIFTSPTFSGSNCLTICLSNKDNATLSAKPCSGNTGWFDSSRYGAICDYRVPSYI